MVIDLIHKQLDKRNRSTENIRREAWVVEVRERLDIRDNDMPLKDTTKFATTADIRQKLHNSLVFYNGIPVYCTNNGESSSIKIYGLMLNESENSKFIKEIEYDDPKLNIQSPRIGYVNKTENTVVYLSRIPSRQFHIGLTYNTVEFRTIVGTKAEGFKNWPFIPQLHDSMIDKYPNATNILNRLYKPANKTWSQAFTRTLAFGFSEQSGLKLFHKNTPIAYYNSKDSSFKSIREGSSLVENILIKHGLKSYAP